MALPRKYVVLSFLMLVMNLQAQDPEEWARHSSGSLTAKENVGMLFTGLGLNIVGVAGMAGTIYWLTILPESEDEYVIPSGAFTASLTLALTGGYLVVHSVQGMIQTRKSYHQQKKSRLKGGQSITIEPTQYGIGVVYRF